MYVSLRHVPLLGKPPWPHAFHVDVKVVGSGVFSVPEHGELTPKDPPQRRTEGLLEQENGVVPVPRGG